jgi:hypothetical protein
MKLRPPKVDGDRKRKMAEGLNINMIHFKARFNTYQWGAHFPSKQLATKY